jgi:hypothetical protein
MSDPQDLLYTNNFTSTDILSNSQLSRETEYYDRFKTYIDQGETDETTKYIEDDLNESSLINLNKTLNTKWPIHSNKNHYPLFDSYVNDISSNRYKKEILTKVNIDSANRDVSKFFNINSFSLPFNKVFNNVKKIVINDIIFPNVNQSISNVNNNLSWQYASSEYLIANNIDLHIIPVPNPVRTISYSSLPNATYSYTLTDDSIDININNYLVYQATVSPGYYTIDSLIKNIRYYTSLILHGSNSLKTFQATNVGKVIEQPYIAYPKRVATPHLFSCSIDPISSIVRFVNRIEEIKLVAIQTFSPYENNFSENDIFYYYSSQYVSDPNYTLDTKYIYITVPALSDITYQYYKNLNCIYSPNAFPLVITDLSITVGNIDPSFINYTEFYDEQIYFTNGYIEPELNTISHYKFIDTITFTGTITVNGVVIPTTKKYLRFGLCLSTGNIHGNNYNPKGTPVVPSVTNNIIFSDSLNNILSNNISQYTFSNTGTCIIGRALLFRWIYDMKNGNYITYEYDTENEKKRSLLHTLAWPIANGTKQIYTTELSYGYKFVHTNYQTFIINKAALDIIKYNKVNIIPSISLNLQYNSNNYYFVSQSYIYLKINFASSEGLQIDVQYINAISSSSLIYNQVYIDDIFFDVGIGQDYTCIENNIPTDVHKKDQSYLFAKVILSNTPGNYDSTLSNIINNNSFHIYYNSALDNVDVINIEVYDSSLKLLPMSNNFSFTLEIHEVKEVLKETFINTKTNNVNTTGNFI